MSTILWKEEESSS